MLRYRMKVTLLVVELLDLGMVSIHPVTTLLSKQVVSKPSPGLDLV